MMKGEIYQREFTSDDPVANGKTCGVCGANFNNVYISVVKYEIGKLTMFCHQECLDRFDDRTMRVTDFIRVSSGSKGIYFSAYMKFGNHACEKCKYVIIDNKEDIRVMLPPKDDYVSVHRKCIPNKCRTCNKGEGLRGVEYFVLEGETVRHQSCVLKPCGICNKMDSNFIIQVDLVGANEKLFLHTTCRDEAISKFGCIKCKLKYGDMVFNIVSQSRDTTSISMQHKSCVTDICSLCSKIVGPDMWIDIGDVNVCHDSCLKLLKCANCGVQGGDMIRTKDGIRHVRKTCTAELCPVCADPIGAESFYKLGEETYHEFCLNEIKCYACGETGNGKKIIDPNRNQFENRFIHDKCNSAKCSDCNNYIGNSPIRTVNGKLYHGGFKWHGPTCDICKEATSDDFANLLPTDDGIYRHTTCDLGECIICLEVLGKKSHQISVDENGQVITEENPGVLVPTLTEFTREKEKKKIRAHNRCVGKCKFCTIYHVDCAPLFDSRLNNRNNCIKLIEENWNPKFLSKDLFDIVMATYMSIRRTAPAVVKQIVRKITILVLSDIQDIDAMLPIRRGIFNMTNMCNHNRCSLNKNCFCGEILAWDPDDKSRCQPNNKRCITLTKALRDIMEASYRKPVYFTWPNTEAEGIKEATIATMKASPSATVFCDAKMRSVEKYMAMRPK